MTVINEIAMKFIENSDFNEKVNDVLEMIGESLNVCRIYIFLDSLDGSTTSNTHEWCNEGVIPQIDNLQDLDYKQFSSWKKMLDIQGKIVEHDIHNLPKDVVEILSIQEIKSIVVFPVIVEGNQVGFVGVDECSKNRFWTEKEIDLVSTVAFMISSTYERELERNLLKVYESNFKSFFNSVDGMLLISDEEGKVIYVNKKFCEKICASKEILGKSIFEFPLDKSKLEKVMDTISSGDIYKSELVVEIKKIKFAAKIKIWKGEYNGDSCIFTVLKNIEHEKELENKFLKIFRNNPAPMAITDIEDYLFVDVNDSFLQSLGYAREDIIGKNVRKVKIFKDNISYESVKKQILNGVEIKNISVRVNKSDGTVIDGILFGEIIISDGRQLLVSVFVDVSEQVNLYKVVNEQKLRLEHIIDSIRAGTWEWDLITDKMIINDKWAEIIGYTVEELRPITINTWKKFVQMDDYVKAQILFNEHFDRVTEFYEAEFRMRHRSGNWIWILSKGKVTHWSEDGKPLRMFGTHTDITELKLMQQQIREVSIKDSLTGLYNRRYFIEYLSHMLEEYNREKNDFSIALVDIDHFKKVNDNYGHLCGDYILKEFSDILVDSLRSYDIVARYGGEEFIVICKNSNRENSVNIMRRILARLREHTFVYDEKEIRITFSGGVADADEVLHKGASVESIIDIADQRLYQAKNSGRDMII
jgi:diguanylate cyclase (GGDEF)-like protein/PAS domain S-box-containing protein